MTTLTDGLVSFAGTLNLGFACKMKPSAGAQDFIYGDSDSDLLIGGAGDDQIEGGDGWELIFGDAFESNLTSIFLTSASGDVNIAAEFARPQVGFKLEGNGVDTIKTNDGGSVVIGGDGGDTMTGGNTGIDALLEIWAVTKSRERVAST